MPTNEAPQTPKPRPFGSACVCIHYPGEVRNCPAHGLGTAFHAQLVQNSSPFRTLERLIEAEGERTGYGDRFTEEHDETELVGEEEAVLPLGWVCPRCDTVWAPHIDYCLCGRG